MGHFLTENFLLMAAFSANDRIFRKFLNFCSFWMKVAKIIMKNNGLYI